MNGMASRLSSFSMFKTKKSKSDTLPLPPPPPPKDPYYSMPNRSMTSLATNSASMPATPLGAPYPYQIPHSQHAARSFIHPSSSSMSLASSSAASAASYSPDVPQTGLTHKKSGFFGRKKKSARSPSIRSEVDSTGTSTQSSAEPQDDGISLPWNFQHNVHVDDGYAIPRRTYNSPLTPLQARRVTPIMDIPAYGCRTIRRRDSSDSAGAAEWFALAISIQRTTPITSRHVDVLFHRVAACAPVVISSTPILRRLYT
ncbi:hypothetical protein CYLTODRAFT_72718 [Cylindrobasidium torrendii FP15055 ss-10]|uniref:CRIB domain-containing protein n=1 Tax=Cylindrobasidium torrendii FP15055 ss-10 TaxID=1314674 RepID=A0A0D7B3W8_9AGAR|nr:hypothetical protein CYLTODRAFT_72718 [Cylindrobasidium torrendii FP15055 ss-10]